MKQGKKVELIHCLMKQHCRQQDRLGGNKGKKLAKTHKSAEGKTGCSGVGNGHRQEAGQRDGAPNKDYSCTFFLRLEPVTG